MRLCGGFQGFRDPEFRDQSLGVKRVVVTPMRQGLARAQACLRCCKKNPHQANTGQDGSSTGMASKAVVLMCEFHMSGMIERRVQLQSKCEVQRLSGRRLYMAVCTPRESSCAVDIHNTKTELCASKHSTMRCGRWGANQDSQQTQC